jgi:hypothetical protein
VKGFVKIPYVGRITAIFETACDCFLRWERYARLCASVKTFSTGSLRKAVCPKFVPNKSKTIRFSHKQSQADKRMPPV